VAVGAAPAPPPATAEARLLSTDGGSGGTLVSPPSPAPALRRILPHFGGDLRREPPPALHACERCWESSSKSLSLPQPLL
jgi:hypothetical protein